jgi:hypothetical protein
MAGASYTQVHGLWKQMTGAQQSASIRAIISTGKPFVKGSRVVHRRQVDKTVCGVVLESTPQQTRVLFPGPKQKRLGGAYLRTVDLIRAPAPPRRDE